MEDTWRKALRGELMESLIFTCLCHTATHLRNVWLNPLKLFPVFFASHDERDQVLLHRVQKLFQETGMCKALFLIYQKHPQIPPPKSQPLSWSQWSFTHTFGWEKKFPLQWLLIEVNSRRVLWLHLSWCWKPAPKSGHSHKICLIPSLQRI